MIKRHGIFSNNSVSAQCGGMLVELLLSVALAAIVMPFVFRYQTRSVQRAENIAITRQMQDINSALELYIMEHRSKLLNTVGQNITRIELADLTEYGIPDDLVTRSGDKYQLRVLKSRDNASGATLQGVVVYTDDEITPIRTREIVSLGGGQIGFLDGIRAYGTFGAWHADTIDLGVAPSDAIVGTTTINRDNALYLWRVPSKDASDATMMAGLNLGGHNLVDAAFFDAANVVFSETLTIGVTSSTRTVFQNRTDIDNEYTTSNATVAGVLSADSKTLDVTGNFKLSDTGKFSNFNTGDLWVSNLNLSGISISDDTSAAILDINRTLDMTSGHISAMYVTVGFAGSITPRLVVSGRVEDSTNSSYYWDSDSGQAHFMDVSLVELNRMASLVTANDKSGASTSYDAFSAVAANKNATVSDFMNAITDIQKKVRAKYRRLNLE